jgi:hypothetical protein
MRAPKLRGHTTTSRWCAARPTAAPTKSSAADRAAPAPLEQHGQPPRAPTADPEAPDDRCQLRYPGICTDHTTIIDHIKALGLGGNDTDDSAQAACVPMPPS